MIAQKSGYIVNISSLAALIGIYGYTAYAPSKFAVRGFSHCLRAELIPFGIDVSIVYPPDTDTPQLAFERSRIPEITKKINEGGGMLSPDKVAEVIIQGIEKKKFVIIPGFEGKVIYRFAALIDTYMYKFAVRIASRDTK
jgi:3-dehydrosphinganine reductase